LIVAYWRLSFPSYTIPASDKRTRPKSSGSELSERPLFPFAVRPRGAKPHHGTSPSPSVGVSVSVDAGDDMKFRLTDGRCSERTGAASRHGPVIEVAAILVVVEVSFSDTDLAPQTYFPLLRKVCRPGSGLASSGPGGRRKIVKSCSLKWFRSMYRCAEVVPALGAWRGVRSGQGGG